MTFFAEPFDWLVTTVGVPFAAGATPDESLRLERMLNDRVAEMVGTNPRRLVGLGTVPLHAPELAGRRGEAAQGVRVVYAQLTPLSA